ncbi:zinc ABC transporter substrate-binding protein [Oceanibacterium hippocampi]|uniref:High-affinity zinc uptake system protein ZnuA n=1 Tax=Oceanibacterium hippocampi TaxID=745714 RepID=A0A1Y5T9R9_9PROT|nr:zinc ABC transporter substrate-binding protein [Oceanibacterium hippocampi]SLN59106.1 High-affinity zinc uptake system protein ZnuA precursor [Oceanibacterium hippocampi]
MYRFLRLPIVAVALLMGSLPATAAAPSVLVSIPPVHALVAAIMAGVGTPDLLIRGLASPHNYALRPSDALKLRRAEIVFWVGPTMEMALAKPIAALGGNDRAIALHEAPGVGILRFREGHADHAGAQASDKDHDADHHGADHDDHDHGHGELDLDMHIWLDPENAIAMSARIAAVLGARDPDNAANYTANAARLDARLRALDQSLATRLAGFAGRPYVVFHDAYQYFERRYGLAPAASITVSPDQSPGARRLHEIRKTIVEAGAACVFVEPQFEPAIARMLVDDTATRIVMLDPLGATLQPGDNAYFLLMEGLAGAFEDCFRAGD